MTSYIIISFLMMVTPGPGVLSCTLLVGCWLVVGWLLAGCWWVAGRLLVGCWLVAGWLLVPKLLGTRFDTVTPHGDRSRNQVEHDWEQVSDTIRTSSGSSLRYKENTETICQHIHLGDHLLAPDRVSLLEHGESHIWRNGTL